MASNPGNLNGSHGGAGSGDLANANASAFERVLDQFKNDLKKKDKDNFQMTSLETLNQAIGEIQKKQLTERRMQNMTRLKRFIEAMDEYGKVVETFCNSSQFVPFIWVSLNHFKNIIVGNTTTAPFISLLVIAFYGNRLPDLVSWDNFFTQLCREASSMAYIATGPNEVLATSMS